MLVGRAVKMPGFLGSRVSGGPPSALSGASERMQYQVPDPGQYG